MYLRQTAMNSLLVTVALVVSACGGLAKKGDAIKLNESGSHSVALVDIAIENATIVDGSGAPAFQGDVLINDGVIVDIGGVDMTTVEAGRKIDAAGRILAPGFIDLHAHGDPITDNFVAALAMGVTTLALGQDGRTVGNVWPRDNLAAPRPIADWLARAETAGVQLNVAPFVGHGAIRYQSGVANKPAEEVTMQDIEAMQETLDAEMAAGAFGMSSGLEYIPGLYSDTRELVALAEIVGRYDGAILSHLRTEDDDAIEGAIEELAAQGAHARVNISHLKVVYGKGAERAERLLAFMEEKRAAGVPLSADIYPYVAGYADLGLVFPQWANEATDYHAAAALRRDELAAYLQARVTKRNGPGAILLTTDPYKNKTVEQAAAEAGQSFVDFLIALGPKGAEAAHFTQDASTHDVLVASPLTAISTDGGPGTPHPRSTATYAKLFEYYVNEKGALSVEEAVRKASGYPASVLGLDDRGLIKEGMAADMVLFDPGAVTSTATFADASPLAQGFDVVIVNGRIAYEVGALTDGRFGHVLKNRKRPQ